MGENLAIVYRDPDHILGHLHKMCITQVAFQGAGSEKQLYLEL